MRILERLERGGYDVFRAAAQPGRERCAADCLAGVEVAAVSRPTSFYYAFLVLPRDQREAMVAVWDFCRAVDDTVDERPQTLGIPPASPLPGRHCRNGATS